MEKKHFLVLVFGTVLILLAGCNLPIASPNTPGGTSIPGLLVTELPAGAPALTGEEAAPIPANTDGAETVLIPGAAFMMGSEESDDIANVDEKPIHQVILSSFYIYTHEVTNAMYAACVADGGCLPVHTYESGPTSHQAKPDYADHPVTGVDWLMAEDYCTWAGGRLPTEAEWELAARGSEGEPYPWGEEQPACDKVNMEGCLAPADTVKVGSYLNGNSPYEGWDMSGNVWEWVNDWYDEDYYALSPTNNPIGPYYSKLKVVRGGGMYSGADKMRSAERAGADPHRALDDVGFRCVPATLALPADYIEPQELHIWGLPDPLEGDGERLDDPEGVPPVPPESEDGIPWVASGRSSVSCPNAEGRMRLYAEIDTSEEDVVYEAYVEENLFSCTYNEVLRALECEGPIPENNDELTEYHVEVYVSGFGIAHFYPDRPLDCPAEMEFPEDVALSMSCPDAEGWVTVYFHYEPAIFWDSILYEGAEVPCMTTSPTSAECHLPALPDGEDYIIVWSGHYESGEAIEWHTNTQNPPDCEAGMGAQTVDPFCFEGHPMVQIMYLPETRALTNVTNDGRLLDCIGMAPGVQICGNLVADPGTPAQVGYCFEDEDDCYEGSVLMPECIPSGTVSTYSITPHCYPGLGPVVVIDYFPADLPLVAANANGFDLTCYDSPEPGFYMCSGIPGSPGSSMTISFCLSDGTCRSADILVSDCEAPNGPVGFWNLVDVNCFHVTDVYMIVDTAIEELIPGADFTYTARTLDGERSYTCEVHPDIAGRIFCYGEPPIHNSSLEVCITLAGQPEACGTFDEFFVRLPLCEAAPTEPPPTEEPGGGEPGVVCGEFTDSDSCNANAECVWRKNLTPPPVEACYPR